MTMVERLKKLSDDERKLTKMREEAIALDAEIQREKEEIGKKLGQVGMYMVDRVLVIVSEDGQGKRSIKQHFPDIYDEPKSKAIK